MKLLLLLLSLRLTLSALDVSVLSYGAIGDGVTDDTQAIVNASKAVAQAGGRLGFPPGTYLFNPSHGNHITIGSNMTIYGAGVIKVKPGSGDFDHILVPIPEDAVIQNVTLAGITIDENVFENPSTVAPIKAQEQNIRAYGLTGLTVNNVKFRVSGAYALKLNGGLTMYNSHITFEKRGDNPWFDNSAIYLRGQLSTCSITNNTFTADTAGANTAIEAHYSHNCTVSGNWFDNYVTAVLPFDSFDISITNNNINRAAYAISLWSQSENQHVTVTNNRIALNNRDRQSQSATGIALYWCSYCTPAGNYSHIAIEGNTVSFQPESRTNLYATCYWGIGIQPAGNVNDVSIKNNVIISAPLRAIKVGNAAVSNMVSDVVVQGNTLINPGTDRAFYETEAGIALEGALSGVTVTGNTITSTAQPFAGHYGIWTGSNAGFSGVSIFGNTIAAFYQNRY